MDTTTAATTGGSWLSQYQNRLMSADQAVQSIQSGDSIYIHSNAAAPQELIEALVRRSNSLQNVEIYHLLTLGPAPYIEP